MKITGQLDYDCWANKDNDFYTGDTVTVDTWFDLDYKDSSMLDEITEKFLNASWSEREKIYNLIAGKNEYF